MIFRALLRRPAAGSFALIALAASAATANAADIAVTDAKIGKLVIAGTTGAPNTWVRLDGQTARDFNVKSGADGAFAFGIVYHPGDCIVDLQKLVSPTSLGAATAALVADCGPAGVSPRGAWNPTTAYVANDLVTYLGSTWRARRGNANKLPVSGVDWEQFAAAGEPAPEGSTGGAANEVVDAGDASPAADTPIGPAGGDLTGTYPNPLLKSLAITSGHITSGAVTLTKLALNSVNTFRILDGAVTGPKLADNAVTGAKIEDAAVANADIANGAVGENKLQDGSITSAKVLDDTQVGGGLAATDLATNSVGQAEIATDGVGATEIQNDSIDSGEIVDFQLSNQDIGVLFAEVNAAGTLANSSGSVTATKVGAAGSGQYEVDFARVITTCTAVATIGGASTGVATGEVNVADRAGNTEAVYVDTNTSAGAAADRPFRLVVVC